MKGKNMRAVLPVAVMSILCATIVEAQELAKAKVAVVRLRAIFQDGGFSDKLKLLSLDKKKLEPMKKIGAEIKALQKEVADAQDQAKLTDLQSKLQFFYQKLSLLTQPTMNSRADPRRLLCDFIISNYKDKYSMILQEETDPFIWKGGVEITDITGDVMEKINEQADEIAIGDIRHVPATYYPPKLVPAVATPPVVKPAPQPGLH